MTVSKYILVAILSSLCLPNVGWGAGQLEWGENVGLVMAYVNRIDNEKGLAIHEAPSARSPVAGYLTSGTVVQGHNEFKQGWVKLKNPVDKGWVDLRYLKPRPFDGTVTKVDPADLCLAIKVGPGAERDKVGCADIGEVLKFTGVLTTDNWMQLADRRGWVDGASVQVTPDLPQSAVAAADIKNSNVRESTQKPPEAKVSPVFSERRTPIADTSVASKVDRPPAGTRPAESVASGSTNSSGTEKNPAEICIGGWCVNYESSQVTHDGRVVPGIECLKDTVCAGAVGQHHAAKAILDGSMTFGKFKLSAAGAISDTVTGREVVSCGDTGGIDDKCVGKFLQKIARGTGESQNNTVKEESGKKSQSAKSRLVSSSKESSHRRKEPAFSGSSFDEGQEYNRNVEGAWEDMDRHGW